MNGTMKEFKINEYLTVKLEGEETVIYVAGEHFIQCKALLLNIPKDDVENFNEIESMDDVADMLNWNEEEGQRGVIYNLPPETEFFGHCSNLQVWYEQKYSTDLLHSSLAFPLLKRLIEVGDPKAQKVFKEELCKKFDNGNLVVVQFLLIEDYLKFLNKEEIFSLLPSILDRIDKNDIYSTNNFPITELISAIKRTSLLKEHFTDILNFLEKIDNNSIKSSAITKLISIIKRTSLLEQHFIIILNFLEKINDYSKKIYPITKLLSAIKKAKLLEEHFATIMDFLEKIDDINNKSKAFFQLISVMKGTNLIRAKFPLIKNRFSHILISLDKMNDDDEKSYILTYLIAAFKRTQLLEEFFTSFFNVMIKIDDNSKILDLFQKLVSATKGTNVIEKNFTYTLILFDKIDEDSLKIKIFYTLIFSIRGTELISEKFIEILNILEKITNSYYKSIAFDQLISAIKGTDLMEEYFIDILNLINKIDGNGDKVYAFSKLMYVIKGTNLMNSEYSLIKDKYSNILNAIDNINNDTDKKYYFSKLASELEGTILLHDDLDFINKNFDKLREDHIYRIITELIKTIKNTDNNKFLDILNVLDKLSTRNKYYLFLDLVSSIKDSELIDKQYNKIKLKFRKYIKHLFEFTEKVVFNEEDVEEFFYAFMHIIDALKGTKLIEFFPFLLDVFDFFPYDKFPTTRYTLFSNLVKSLNGTELESKLFNRFCKIIKKFSDYESHEERPNWIYLINFLESLSDEFVNEKFFDLLHLVDISPAGHYFPFLILFGRIIKTKLLIEKFSELFSKLHRVDDAFLALLDTIKGTNLLKEKLSELCNIVENFSDYKENYTGTEDFCNEKWAFFTLIRELENSQLLKENSSFIKERFPEYTDEIEEILEKKNL